MSLIQDLVTDLERYYNLNFRELRLRNPQFHRDGNQLTWHGNTGPMRTQDYGELYRLSAERRQFSLELEDESFIQLYYATDGDDLIRASTSYLPGYLALMGGASYFRFDCDCAAGRDYTHTPYHAHFGHGCTIRLSVHEFPFPSQFLDLVMHLVYAKERPWPDNRASRLKTLDDLRSKYCAYVKIR